ncbi:MAG: hypothetical protein AAFV45_08785 [Pseudomonadota bacterium]
MAEHSTELHAILNEYGRQPGFATCKCASCHQSRVVEKRITTRQALHSAMGQAYADRMLREMGWHWTVVAMIAGAHERTPATDCIKALADAGFELS